MKLNLLKIIREHFNLPYNLNVFFAGMFVGAAVMGGYAYFERRPIATPKPKPKPRFTVEGLVMPGNCPNVYLYRDNLTGDEYVCFYGSGTWRIVEGKKNQLENP